MREQALADAEQFGSGETDRVVGKQAKKARILDYLSNPENPWIDRQTLATEVLGYRKAQSLWNLIPSAELNQIEQEALELRRKRCAHISARVDQALLEKALSGNVQAIKLYYQRFEGWSEKLLLDPRDSRKQTVVVINTGTDDEEAEILDKREAEPARTIRV